MLDFKGCFDLIKSATVEAAKATHKPSIHCKASMQAFQKAAGTTGKAVFCDEQKSDMIEYTF